LAVYVPSEWLEVKAQDYDPTKTRIAASKSSNLFGWNPGEMLMVTEIETPKFEDFIGVCQNESVNPQMKVDLYQRAVADVFDKLVDTKMQLLELMVKGTTYVIGRRISGEMDNWIFSKNTCF
jgi:hypothetical protein